MLYPLSYEGGGGSLYRWWVDRDRRPVRSRNKMITFPPAIREAVVTALSAAAADGSLPPLDGVEFVVERPRDRNNGDWSVNVGMTAAKRAGRSPRDIAEAVVAHLPTIPHLERVEVAGPGFINFTLAATWYQDVLRRAALGGSGHARSDAGSGERIQVEFVSSNPNGPLHIGHGRGGVIGDVLCRMLEYMGHSVSREYYYNDAGVQMDRFASSLEALTSRPSGGTPSCPRMGTTGTTWRSGGENSPQRRVGLLPTGRIAPCGFVSGVWVERCATSRRPWCSPDSVRRVVLRTRTARRRQGRYRHPGAAGAWVRLRVGGSHLVPHHRFR